MQLHKYDRRRPITAKILYTIQLRNSEQRLQTLTGLQTARTEGCPIQTNATCVTGQCLAHVLLRASVRVTTQRSAVVTRTYSGLKYAACQNFLNIRPTAPGIMASCAKHFLQHW